MADGSWMNLYSFLLFQVACYQANFPRLRVSLASILDPIFKDRSNSFLLIQGCTHLWLHTLCQRSGTFSTRARIVNVICTRPASQHCSKLRSAWSDPWFLFWSDFEISKLHPFEKVDEVQDGWFNKARTFVLCFFLLIPIPSHSRNHPKLHHLYWNSIHSLSSTSSVQVALELQLQLEDLGEPESIEFQSNPTK